MSEPPKIYGFVYTDAEGNPRLPVVSLVDPETDPYVTEPYRLIYVGDDQQACIEAIQASIVVQDDRARWAKADDVGGE